MFFEDVRYLTLMILRQPREMLPPEAHVAASKGKLAELQLQIEERGPQVLTERDEQGWQVLHQGVAGGNEKVVEFLVELGADINARTLGGGETPLRIAERRFGFNSPLAKYLKTMGALSIGPEL
jgi:ankyrin repeat protein